jgi:2-polyprenyl-3-methyl-5-hydroxy-6-metoxy-1,4-benzoquinol methylase
MNNKKISKSFNLSEKIFSSFCHKNRKWGSVEKENISAEKLLSIQKAEWDVFWNKLDESNVSFKDKIVVDYGCAYGFDSIFMLQEGAKHVHCFEITQERLDISQKLIHLMVSIMQPILIIQILMNYQIKLEYKNSTS